MKVNEVKALGTTFREFVLTEEEARIFYCALGVTMGEYKVSEEELAIYNILGDYFDK